MHRLLLALALALVSQLAARSPRSISTPPPRTSSSRCPGIGPAKAQAIIDYRNAARRVQAVEELKDVKGIGAKRFEKLKAELDVASPAAKPAARPAEGAGRGARPTPSAIRQPAGRLAEVRHRPYTSGIARCVRGGTRPRLRRWGVHGRSTRPHARRVMAGRVARHCAGAGAAHPRIHPYGEIHDETSAARASRCCWSRASRSLPSTSTPRPRKNSRRCPASARSRRRRSSTTARPTVRSSRPKTS